MQYSDLVLEQKSPLFRIMSIANPTSSTSRRFDNNICAFHIGKGYFLSVAHNLRTFPAVIYNVPDAIYRTELAPKMNPQEAQIFSQAYFHDSQTNSWVNNLAFDVGQMAGFFSRTNFDRRFVTQYTRGISSPHLIIQFSEDKFFGDSSYESLVAPEYVFYEAPLKRTTFLLGLELVKAWYESDIAVYRLTGDFLPLASRIPSLSLDFRRLTKRKRNFFCLQAAPLDNLGRLLNEAKIEGVLDTFSVFKDPFGGDYNIDGYRYLIEGYFRFGSSGAPYLTKNWLTGRIRANAIQSQASPLQLSIGGQMGGNMQYVNGIASPLSNVKAELKELGF